MKLLHNSLSACALSAFILSSHLFAEDGDKMHINAAIDLSPLAQKLNELAKLSVVTTSIVKEQVGKIAPAVAQSNKEASATLEKVLNDNHAKLTEKFDELAEAIASIKDSFPPQPISYEYMFLRSPSEKRAQELGAAGWILVGITQQDFLIFHKPVYQGATGGLAPAGGLKMEEKK
ncbi:MAG: hypothetical protein O3B01_06845 [Planctomycetota bacterium]|nr:hypothetical protein [Planctomycetota bacterium]MDA1138284.1 hypothetical protein [Planctomycetota bacterium]